MSITEDLQDLRKERAQHHMARSWLSLRTSLLVKDARSHGLTPTEIAELAGVSRQHVHNILKENQ